MGGLDEHRQPQRGDLARAPARARARSAPRARRRSRPAGRPAAGHQLLEQDLVHAHRRGGDPRADVGDVERLQHPLHGPVLAERPVQDREDDVGAEQPVAGRARSRPLALAAPGAVAADLDPDDLVAGREQAVAHGRRRGRARRRARRSARPRARRPCSARAPGGALPRLARPGDARSAGGVVIGAVAAVARWSSAWSAWWSSAWSAAERADRDRDRRRPCAPCGRRPGSA